MAFIEFKKIRKVYKTGDVETEAIKDVSFQIEKGELVIIVGASGAGKTTILNLLGGMDICTSGEITFDGENIDTMSLNQLIKYRRLDVGFVFQFYNLVQNLTTLENVELASQICENPLDETSVLESVGLKNRLDNFPSQLSGGEQQRVAIARAIAKNPKILLCDEPTGALDYETGKKVLNILQDISRTQDKTVIIITHNSALEAIADRVIKVHSGTISNIIINPTPADIGGIEW